MVFRDSHLYSGKSFIKENILSFSFNSTAKFLSCTCNPPSFYKRKEEREKERKRERRKET
jgi:tRNA1(Val) A37 N6-methylase TrmN6